MDNCVWELGSHYWGSYLQISKRGGQTEPCGVGLESEVSRQTHGVLIHTHKIHIIYLCVYILFIF